MPLDLTEYKVLSFDIYGTLINWETGIFEELLERLGGATDVERTMGATSAESLRNGLLSMYAGEEKRLQKEFPGMGYQSLLSEIYLLIGERLEIVVEQDKALSFGASIPQWPAFTDTVAAMKKLAKYYKLVVLSNVDEESFRATLRVPLEGVKFDAVYTAEEIGSYKPAPENFEYLIEHVKKDFLVPKDQILHVANSLTHDHIPAKKIGMRPGVWIERRGERCCLTGNVNSILKSGKVEFGARFKNLRELAEAVEKAFEEKKERDANPGAGTNNWL